MLLYGLAQPLVLPSSIMRRPCLDADYSFSLDPGIKTHRAELQPGAKPQLTLHVSENEMFTDIRR